MLETKKYENMIGKEIHKLSGKKFKNKEKVETVVGISTNPYTNKQTFTFKNGSFIECRMCCLKK